MMLLVLCLFFFKRPSFIVPLFNRPHVSAVLSLFPYSLALIYCPTLLPSSLHLVIAAGEVESQRTCLFINVADGSHQRRGKKSRKWVVGSETGARERKCDKEKKGGKCEREQPESFHSACKLMERLVKCTPGGPLTARETCVFQPLAAVEI